MPGKLSLWLYFVLAVPLVSTGSQYDHDNVVGEWAQYSRNESGEFGYYYLKVQPDFSGLFSYQLYGSEPVLVPFSDEDLSLEDGFLVLVLAHRGRCTRAPRWARASMRSTE